MLIELARIDPAFASRRTRISAQVARMVGPNAETWIAALAALVSVAGAIMSGWQALRQRKWEFGKEFGAFRSDTLVLIDDAVFLEMPMHSVGLNDFRRDVAKWQTELEVREPLLGPRALKDLNRLSDAFDDAAKEVFAAGRVYSSKSDDHPIVGQLGDETIATLTELRRRIGADRHFMSK